MTFYFIPPRGNVSLERIKLYSLKRLQFLSDFSKSCSNSSKNVDIASLSELLHNHTENSECLIEGTFEDSLSHFILRLAASGHSSMASFFIEAETLFFRFRFNELTLREKCQLLSKALTQANMCKFTDSEYQQVVNVTKRVIEEILHHWLNVQNDRFSILVPFQYVLNMVSERSVVLRKGQAVVTFDLVNELLISLFEMSLTYGLSHISRTCQDVLYDDVRIQKLCKILMSFFFKLHRTDNSHRNCRSNFVLKSDRVDSESFNFPLCMRTLHHQLRQRHRLPHKGRIEYTLFLKEVGLPLDEAIVFWQKEYSSACSSTQCQHSWDKDGRRYEYSLRHLYGREGSRKNYSAHCCHALQSSGLYGCPYANFDTYHLSEMLFKAGLMEREVDKIVSLSRSKKFKDACNCHLEHILKSNSVFRKCTVKNTTLKSKSIVSTKEATEIIFKEPSIEIKAHNSSVSLSRMLTCQLNTACDKEIDTDQNQDISSSIECMEHQYCNSSQSQDNIFEACFDIRKPSEFFGTLKSLQTELEKNK